MQTDNVLERVNDNPLPALVLDEEDRVLILNNTAIALLGYPSEELVGSTFNSLVLRPKGERANAADRGGIGYHPKTVALRTKGDAYIVVEIVGRSTRSKDRLLTEISLRERDQTVFDISNDEMRRHQIAIDTWEVGIYEVDHRTNYIYASPRTRKAYGFDADIPLTAEMIFKSVHPGEEEKMASALECAWAPDGNGRFDSEHRVVWPDGTVHWLHSRAQTEFGQVDGQRVPLGTNGSIVDITDRKMAQIETKRRTEILEATPDIVGIVDHEQRLLYINRSGRELFGIVPGQERADRPLSAVYTDASLEVVRNIAIPAAHKDGHWRGEADMVKSDGTVFPVSQVVLAHKDGDGAVTHLSTLSRDLTREKLLEEQFRQAQKLEAVGRLAGGIAHDFNNMLSAIIGFGELALDKLTPDHDARHNIEEMLRASERSVALTRQLLAFSRKQILHPKIVDVNEVIRDCRNMLVRLLDDSIRLNMTTGTAAVNIKADPNQLEQILLNLVVNGRDAMPEGGTLSIEVSRVILDEQKAAGRLDLEAGLYATIAVSDTGTGMDATTREKIFEPFFTTKGAGRGTGLGLATVYGIVKQSGGGIWVYSEPGRGTTFKLYFPCTDERPATPAPSIGAVRPTLGGVVLLAEDEPQLRDMLTTSLEHAGYEVLCAENGESALAAAQAYIGEIDLLLTDVLMPGMSGRQLAERLLETRPSTAVLYMSGYTEDSIVHHGVLDEGVNFISKPVTPRHLLRAIDAVLNGCPIMPPDF